MKYTYTAFLCLLSIAHARFSTQDDTSYTIENEKEKYTIHKDGTYEVESEYVIEIKKEEARSEFSKRVLVYRDKTEKLEVIEAKTFFEGKEYPVQKDAIEDKNLASSSNGFEDNRQIIVAYPKAEIGAKLYIKTKLKSDLVITKNHFYTNLAPLSTQGWTKDYTLKLTSEIPLNVMVNDPNCVLDVKTDVKDFKKEKIKSLDITLKSPGTEATINDIHGNLNAQKKTWISLSSLDDWKTMTKDLMPKYDEALNAPLPNLYKEIVIEAKKEESEKGKITKVMALLAEKVQYLGSWMTFKGMFIPRTMEEVEKSRFADCKDFSTGTVAMLRALGFEAEVVFVERGYNPEEEYGLVCWRFNHAIVKAIGSDKKVYWLDPTNFTSSTNIMPDIAGRPVIVPVDHKKFESQIQQIPSTEAFNSSREQKISITKDDRLENTITFDFSETSMPAMKLTGIHLKMPATSVEDLLFNSILGYMVSDKDRIKADVPDLKDRIIKPIHLSLSYLSHDLLQSNVGQSFVLESYSPFVLEIANVKESDIHDWFVDYSGRYILKTIIDKIKIKNPEKLNEKIETPWFKVARTASHKDEGTIIETSIEILSEKIKNEDLKSEIFLKAQDQINRKFRKIVLELN